jgi:MFS family permease
MQVLWLLPVFLLLSLAMGATSMPRMNVMISLICRNILAKGMPADLQGSANSGMQQKRQHGGMHSAAMNMSTATGNFSSSAIIIGEYNPQCSFQQVESATAMFSLWGNLLAGTIAAVATPFWGKLSDRFGRVKPLAAATTVMLVSEIIMVLIAKYPDALSLNWVYLTFVLEGIRWVSIIQSSRIQTLNKASGSFILIMALASSYAADCTKLDDRNVALGWFHGSMFFGMAAGPVFGGYLGMSGGKSNPLLIFYTGLVSGQSFTVLFLPLTKF